jgi:hypothetical protein
VGTPLNLSLSYTERNQDENQGIFSFCLIPPLLNFKEMNLSQRVAILCDYSAYTVTDLSYDRGTLSITVDFSEDLEGRNCNLTVSYDTSLIRSPDSFLAFTVQSNTTALILFSKTRELQQITFIFRMLSYIALALFLLSLGHKMIGAELLSSCQLVYLSYCFYQRPSVLFSSLQSFGLVTGYWSLFYDAADSKLVSDFSDRVQLAPQFLESSLVVSCVLFVVFSLWMILLAVRRCTENV